MKLWLMAVVVIMGTAGAVADLVVTNNADAGPGSLRQAILDANGLGGGTITFGSVSGTIMLQSGLPVLAGNMIIVGPGANQLTLNAPTDSVFTNATAGTAYISELSLTGAGTIIQNDGSLTLSECVVTNAHRPNAPPYSPPRGIANSGILTLNGCSVSGNHSSGFPGAGIYNTGSLNLNSCTVRENDGRIGDGAGIYSSGSAILNHCDVSGNTAMDNSSGGIYNSGTMSLTNCTLTRNSSAGAAGGSGGGGGVFNQGNLTMASCTIAENHGGGIDNGAGQVLLLNCSVTNNYRGGGYAGVGAGIFNLSKLEVVGSTISGNRGYGRYDGSFSSGGGLFNSGTASLVNTTVSGNLVSGKGAGICNYNGATLRLLNCTIVSNYISDPFEPQGGGGVWNAGTLHSQNSLIAGNSSLHSPDFEGPLIADGPNLIQDTNGLTLTSVSAGLVSGINPRLGPLQNNGGPTWTHALLPGNPAIDAGDPMGAPIEDQRGVARPQGLGVDLGAFEFQFQVPVFMGTTIQSGTNLCLRACGLPFKSYGLYVSEDFQSWASVTNWTTGADGVCQFIEYGYFNYPRRFFELRATSP